jgi:hypothetical protein
MSEFVPTFESLAGGVLAAVYVALLIVESQFPLRDAKRPKPKRFHLNGCLSALDHGTVVYEETPDAHA